MTEGSVRLEYCPTMEMMADMLTKGLSHEQFFKLRKMAGIVELSNIMSASEVECWKDALLASCGLQLY